jgi:hypothetical protein
MSGRYPPHGLRAEVTVISGPHPPHGNPVHSITGGQHSAPTTPHHQADTQRFTRNEIVSLRLVDRKPDRFFVSLSTHTPGEIQIESIEIQVCEDEKPVFNIPVCSGVRVKKARNAQIFRLTDQQYAAIPEHLRERESVRVTVRYLAAEESELKISIVEKNSHHVLRHVLAIVALGFAVQSVTKHLSRSG